MGVLNTHLVHSLRARLQALRGTPMAGWNETIESPSQRADRLEALLLRGAPSHEDIVALEIKASAISVVPAPGTCTVYITSD
jgi:hypothetical protein